MIGNTLVYKQCGEIQNQLVSTCNKPKGKRKGLPFGVGYLWCCLNQKIINPDISIFIWSTQIGKKKTRLNISYPSIHSQILLSLHTDELPALIFNGFISSNDEETESDDKCTKRVTYTVLMLTPIFYLLLRLPL